MKRAFQLVLVLVVVIAAFNFMGVEAVAQKEQPYSTHEFTINQPGKLQVETSGGSINVTSHNSNQVRVEMHVHKGGKKFSAGDAEARELLEDYEINISQSGNTVSAIAEKKRSGWLGNNTSISFTVFVPEQMACNLHTSGDSIKLSGVKGRQEVKTSGGSLSLTRINGDMVAKTSGGSIKIEGYTGVLEARTSGGSIKLQDAQGELALHTSGGSIKLDNVGGSVEASTSGGGIKADMVKLEKHLRLQTSGGSITAVVPNGLGMDLNLRGNRVNTRLTNFNGQAEKDRITGSMNGGGIPVVLSTTGGSVNLEYR